MRLNEKKTENMIFNYTDNYQFSTRIKLQGDVVETVKNTQLFGTIISDNLCWDLNTSNIVQRANARMELLRRVASFGTSVEGMKND